MLLIKPFQLRKKQFFQKLLLHDTYCNLQNQFQFILLYFIFYLLNHLILFNLQMNFIYLTVENLNNLKLDGIFWMLSKMQFLNYYKFQYHILHFPLYTQHILLDSNFNSIINQNQIQYYPRINLDQILLFSNVSIILNFFFYLCLFILHLTL